MILMHRIRTKSNEVYTVGSSWPADTDEGRLHVKQNGLIVGYIFMVEEGRIEAPVVEDEVDDDGKPVQDDKGRTVEVETSTRTVTVLPAYYEVWCLSTRTYDVIKSVIEAGGEDRRVILQRVAEEFARATVARRTIPWHEVRSADEMWPALVAYEEIHKRFQVLADESADEGEDGAGPPSVGNNGTQQPTPQPTQPQAD